MRDWREYRRLRERLKAELRAAHEAGPNEYLSDKQPRSPRPRFRLRVSTSPVSDLSRRRHRKSGQKPSGRPVLTSDAFLASRVFQLMQTEGLSATDATKRIADTLSVDMGIQVKNARERVYRSLARYREYREGRFIQ